MRPLVLTLCAVLLAACPGGDDDDSTEDPTPPPVDWLPDPWPWCPSADSAVGDGEATLTVGSGALYCATFNEARTLQEELTSKALVRIVEGAYPLPAEEGVTAFALPVCAELAPGDPGAGTAGAGELDAAPDLSGSGSYRLLLDLPLATSDGDDWQLATWLQGPSADLVAGGEITLDGEHHGLATNSDRSVFLQLCEGACADFADGVVFDSCTFDGVATQRHRLEFEGGWIELDIRIGQSLLATQPALFLAARGELDGEPFEQLDYWKLIYNPEHHHFSRDFVVLLDAPPAGSCGIKVEHADPWQDPPPTRVTLVDCALDEVEERTVGSEEFDTDAD